MAVNHEIKSQLAKLLATEDLVVEHKQVETACFNVQTRVLTLPMWEHASSVVYDMLVGHEVGHALYTPDEDWYLENKIPPQLVNVVEDARIEKLMKRRYPGLAKTFYNGYGQLSEQDFFQLENEDISKMNLADKINLYFKIGNFIDVPFDSYEESVLVQKVADVETFQEVLQVAEELYQYCKDVSENQNQSSLNDQKQEQSGTDGESTESESSESEETDADLDTPSYEKESDEGGTEPDQESAMNGGQNFDPDTIKTMQSFEDGMKELANMDGFENVYAELPNVNLNQIIVSNEEVHARCSDEWETDHPYLQPGAFDYVDDLFAQFKKSAQKEVNYLVKEFECKKSASAYARATTSRTGILDCTKLHTYKYNEDLFRKVSVIPDGKNHGLIFILDWSGSMADVMLDTCKQLFNLIWFCKKVNIPFDVYAFTNEYPRENMEPSYKKEDGVVVVPEHFSLLNLFTHKTKGRDIEKQMKNIFRMAYSFRSSWGTNYRIPIGMGLSGTPLNEALITLHKLIPTFKKVNNVEKVQCVILTDGEAPPVRYHKKFIGGRFEHSTEDYIGVNSLGPNSFIRNRKTGHTYSLNVPWYEFSNVLLRDLRNSFPSTNFIGIRVLAPRDANSFMRIYFTGSDYFTAQTKWKKTKSMVITNSGYHKYFGLSSKVMNQESDFEVKEDATKGQIKSAFVKSLRTKKMNKKVLSEFIELIA